MNTGQRMYDGSADLEMAVAFEQNVAAARAAADERGERVARAIERLRGGELDGSAVVEATAARLIAWGFRTI